MKNIFSAKLYVEGLKKLRFIGVGFGIFSVIAVFMPLITNAAVSGGNVAHLYYPFIICMLFSPVAVFSVFGFLFDRKRSEEALTDAPSRSRLFLSLLSSCVSVSFGLIILCFALSFSIWASSVSDLAVNTLVSLIPIVFSSSLKLMGLAAIAVFITGNKSSCYVTFVFSTLSLFVLSYVLYLSPSYFFPSFAGYIGPFSLLGAEALSPFSAIFTGLYSDLYHGAWSVIYSFIAGIAIFVVARHLLILREHDYAEKSVTRNSYRNFIRLCVSFPLALYGVFNLLIYFLSASASDYLNGERLLHFAVALILSLLLWALCDAILYNDLKKGLKSLTAVPLLLFAVSCYATAMLVMRGAILSFMPERYDIEELVSVSDIELFYAPDGSEIFLEQLFDIDFAHNSIITTTEDIQHHRFDEDYPTVTLTVRLKNGETVTRVVYR